MRLLILLLFTSTLSFGQEVLLSENFNDGLPGDWTVETDNSKRKWIHKRYKDFSYMHMSAFGGKDKPGYKVKTTLHTPLFDIEDKECKLRFTFADAYKNGQPINVILSNEKKKPLKSLASNNWDTLVNNENSYDNLEESTPWIPLPKIKQPYHISFVYNSQTEPKKISTTLIQLSEVDVWCE